MSSETVAVAGGQKSALREYLDGVDASSPIDPAVVSYYAALETVAMTSPETARSIVRELHSQRSNVKLIASENYSSLAVQLAQGNLLVDKYAEGFPQHRFYAGCENVDDIEENAAALVCELFGADHAYVQPHSGADANLVAFLGLLSHAVESPELEKLGERNPAKVGAEDWEALRGKLGNQRLMALDFFSGGHLTHGYRHNFSSRLFEAHTYTVDRESFLLDLDAIWRQAKEVKPLILLAGYSAYTRAIDFAKFRDIADDVGAFLMVDMAHFAGLVAGGVFEGAHNPVPSAHVLTMTTHKTLRGPRGGVVLCQEQFAPAIDKGCPMVLGGPLPHVMAAKAVAFREALRPEFRDYAHRIVDNARSLAEELIKRGVPVLTDGTDNHIVLADVADGFGITGWQAEGALRRCGLTLNRNGLPFDGNGPWFTSGLRFGSSAITTLGMGPAEISEIADIVHDVLGGVRPVAVENAGPGAAAGKKEFELSEKIVESSRQRVSELLAQFPVYPELDLTLLEQYFDPSDAGTPPPQGA